MVYTGTPVQTHSSGSRMVAGLAGNQETYKEQVMREIAYHQGIETPFLTAFQTFDITNPLYSFVMAHIDYDRTSIPADIEGKSHTAQGVQTDRSRIRGYNGIHIHSRDVAVTDIARHVDEVGVGDEFEQQAWEQQLALSIELENLLLWSEFVQGTSSTYTVAGTAPQTHGWFAWAFYTGLAAGNVTIAGQVIPAPYKATYYKGNGTPMTRTQFNTKMLQPYWAAGGELSRTLFFVGSSVKPVISGYAMQHNGSGATLTATPLVDRNVAASAYMLHDKLDIYLSDWGEVFAIKNRNMANDTPFANFGLNGSDAAANAGVLTGQNVTPSTAILGMRPSMCEYGVMLPISFVPTAKTGSTTEGYTEAVVGTVVRNPRCLVAGHDLAA